MECKCIEFVAAGWCTGKMLRLYQTIRNLTFGDMGIPLVVIRLGVTRLKKIRIMYLPEGTSFLPLATGKSLRKLSKVVPVLPMSVVKFLYTCLFMLFQCSPNTSAILHG